MNLLKKCVTCREWRHRCCYVCSDAETESMRLHRIFYFNGLSPTIHQSSSSSAHTLTWMALYADKPTPFSFFECAPCAPWVYLHVNVCVCLCAILSQSSIRGVCAVILDFSRVSLRTRAITSNQYKQQESVENRTQRTLDCIKRPSVFISSRSGISINRRAQQTGASLSSDERSLSFVYFLFRCAFGTNSVAITVKISSQRVGRKSSERRRCRWSRTQKSKILTQK